MTILPENILKHMSKADRAKLGKAGVLASEATEKFSAKREKDVQRDICNWLRQRDIFYFWSRTDRKTTTIKGTPDFAFLWPVEDGKGDPTAVEVKIGKNALSDEQQRVRWLMEKEGWNYLVVNSLTELRVWLGIAPPP